MDALKRINERVTRNGAFYDKSTPTPLLTLNEFFEGNDVVGSIGCNLPGAPHPSEIWKVLEAIHSRDSVHCVYIQITEMDDPDWPFSDTAWIVTTDSESDIKILFPEDLAPDEIWEGFTEGESYEKIDIPNGYKVLACWWD